MKIDNIEIIITGRLFKTASLLDEWEADTVDPRILIQKIKNKIKADIFTFTQRITDTKPRYDYFMEWDNVAAIPVSSFDYWWVEQIDDKTRNRIRKAEKNGVKIKIDSFNDDLVRGVVSIFNETSIRQGKRFLHYGKNFQDVKRALSDRSDRSIFIAAYYNNELIGYVKLIDALTYARIGEAIAKIKHRDKSLMNALIAKAVEVCAEKKYPFLVFGKFTYGNKGVDTLTSFKVNNGFKQINFPRYYIPFSAMGRIILALRFHRGIAGIMPGKLIRLLIHLRKKWYSMKYRKV